MSVRPNAAIAAAALCVPRSGRPVHGRLAAAVLSALVFLVLTAGAAQAKLSALGPVDPGNNFPTYYQDANGLRLEPCLTGAPLCFAAAADLVAPDGEAFYNNATATLTTRGNGKATLVTAVEAARGPVVALCVGGRPLPDVAVGMASTGAEVRESPDHADAS